MGRILKLNFGWLTFDFLSFEQVHVASGAGALNAMQDAIVLANWIVALPSRSAEEMEKAFKAYKKERFGVAMAAYNNGRLLSKVPGAVS